MTDGLRATRHEPLTTEVELANGDTFVFKAHPLPWRMRNDFGALLNAQYSTAFNAQLQAVRDATTNELLTIEGKLFEADIDYNALFLMGYSTYDANDKGEIVVKDAPPKAALRAFALCDFDKTVEILTAVLKINGLDRLEHLLDPERKVPPLTGASEPANEETTDAGEKTELLTVSG